MAIITCQECGEKISSKVKKCIHCGYKQKKNRVEQQTKENKPKRKKIIILLLILIVIIIVILGFFYKNFYDKKVKAEKELIEREKIFKEIDNFLDKFSDTHEGLLSEKIDEVYDDIFSGGYFIKMASKEKKWIQIMDEYKEIIDIEYGLIKKIEELCYNTDYIRCQGNYIGKDYIYLGTPYGVYEGDVNDFVFEVKHYNLYINDYNTWAKNYNKYGGNAQYLDDYTSSKYSNYIDYNGDGVFINKEENDKYITSYKKYKP